MNKQKIKRSALACLIASIFVPHPCVASCTENARENCAKGEICVRSELSLNKECTCLPCPTDEAYQPESEAKSPAEISNELSNEGGKS